MMRDACARRFHALTCVSMCLLRLCVCGWGGTDYGMPQDACTDPNGPKDQGVFLPQKDQYLRGKFIRIAPEALLKNNYLVKGTPHTHRQTGAGRQQTLVWLGGDEEREGSPA